jgi:glutamate 5-kinase
VVALGKGILHGTLVAAHGNRISPRKQWLRHAPASGVMQVDAGEAAALREASLLPGDVHAVAGDFSRGNVVDVHSGADELLARRQAQYNASETLRIADRYSRDIEAVLGFCHGEVMIRRDDLVLLSSAEQLSPEKTA